MGDALSIDRYLAKKAAGQVDLTYDGDRDYMLVAFHRFNAETGERIADEIRRVRPVSLEARIDAIGGKIDTLEAEMAGYLTAAADFDAAISAAPVVKITTPADGSVVSGTIQIACTVAPVPESDIASVVLRLAPLFGDGLGEPVATVQAVDQGGGVWSKAAPLGGFDPGAYILHAAATDSSGRVGADSIQFEIEA